MRSNRKAVFDAVYREYYNNVYHVALQSTGDRHAAEDITQDVFLKYYLYTAASEVESPKAWLMTVSARLASNHKKKRFKETTEGLGGVGKEFASYESDPEHIFFEKMWECERIESAELVLGALKRKNENWYDAVTYVYAMSRKRDEVADIMGISVTALDGLLKRAKNWIKKRYKNEYDRINSK